MTNQDHQVNVTKTTKTELTTMKWKTYPMGAAAAERMEIRGLSAHLDHAVKEPCDLQSKALCGVKTFSLCLDSSLATEEMPECTRCQKIIKANA